MTSNKGSPTSQAERASVLRATRNFKMARSAHAYVRGNTLKFYEWLESLASSALPHGPAVWICGDCHVGNIGPVANADGHIDIQIRDFDQAVIGNPAHDLIRLGLSLAMAARGSNLPGVATAHLLEALVEGYEQAFCARPAKSSSAEVRPQAVLASLRDARGRSWRSLAAERVEGATDKFPKSKRFWRLNRREKPALENLFASQDIAELATRLRRRDEMAATQLADAAYWVKGCSSLGFLRYAVLLDVGGRAAGGRDLCLFDVKEATVASAPAYAKATMPTDHGQRVLEGARHLSPHLGDRMMSTSLLNHSVFVRELLPQDLKLEIDSIDRDEAVRTARYLAQVVGRAHAIQLDKAERKRWRAELARNRSKSLDAPSWLWTSVVELIASHERGYLDHCRRYAQGELR
jgi:uncharacterized protein (DUF2252 family)